MVDVIIRARASHNLGHRTIAAQHELCRGKFASREDAMWFARRLGWSAFRVEVVEDAEPQPTSAAEPQAAIEPQAPAPKPKSKR